eukprot:scaffold14600_cov150-Skeletonema_dohrnii-CCMP3373.AAC.2
MGRKRNQGKARKAAKVKAREEAEEVRGNDKQATNLEQSLTAQMSNNNNAPTAGNDTIKMTCRHGFKIFDSAVSLQFATAFREAFYESAKGGGAGILSCLKAAEYATKDKFADVWNDSTKMEIAMSYFLFNGTRNILEGSNDVAKDCAVFARSIEQYIAVKLHQTRALVNFPKLNEIYNPSDVHTLVKFFRKRIPCSCLDAKYDEVKNITKMGMCYNQECSIPNGIVERSKTMYCSRCRCVTYCSPECQKAHWAQHKPICDNKAAIKAKFDAEH